MILFGGPSSFYLFSSCVYVVLPAIVLVHLQGVDSPVVDFLVVGFLVADMQWLVEFLVGFLR